ncbi:hypothetical protein Plano_2668 [Planococcus sp. PAMC 21323]|nr:hypothetical protein Plano_2668 [Planococcus sp. PAMC 21323]
MRTIFNRIINLYEQTNAKVAYGCDKMSGTKKRGPDLKEAIN